MTKYSAVVMGIVPKVYEFTNSAQAEGFEFAMISQGYFTRSFGKVNGDWYCMLYYLPDDDESMMRGV